jgi:hypothetical protein
MTNDLKDKLNKTTEQLEQILEPWQRGLLLIALITFLVFAVYQLTKKEKPQPRELTETERKKLEALAEERILKRVEFLNRLRK